MVWIWMKLQLSHELEDKYLFEFNVEQLWGDGWWAEVERAQEDENCPVMVWLQLAYNELNEGRVPPPPDPAKAETAWWHKELVSADRPVSEIISFKSKDTANGGDVQRPSNRTAENAGGNCLACALIIVSPRCRGHISNLKIWRMVLAEDASLYCGVHARMQFLPPQATC